MAVSASNPRSDEKYDAIASSYDEGYKGVRWDLYDTVTLDFAGTFMPPAPARILDAGAGSGKFSLKLLALGHDVTLLDPSREMLDVARRKISTAFPEKQVEYVVGTIERMEFPEGSFDFVFCEGDPLSYCIDTHRQAAREILRVLRPGGGFYASLDNRWYASLALLASGRPDMAWEAFEEGKSRDPYGVAVHAFHPAELESVFVDAGALDVTVAGKVTLANFMPEKALEALVADPATREKVYEMEKRLGRDPRAAAMAGHLHVVGRKP